ncbi:MAG: lipid-transfer protein, partial [Acidimicrobiia bacterium]
MPAKAKETDLAIIGYAQSPSWRAADLTEPQFLFPVISEAIERAGIDRRDLGFTCAGSCDYLSGQTFAFVMNLEAVGAWPPISESHVEMDGAWALYEAWVRLQHGDIDTALAFGSGKSSPGTPSEIFPLQMDPYTITPLGADPVSLAALQARAMLDAGLATERDFAEVAARSRRSAVGNPYAQVSGEFDVDALLAEPYATAPLRRHDLPPISDGAT